MDDQDQVKKKIILKYVVIAALVLLIINVGLFFVNQKLNPKSLIGTKDQEGFLQTIPNQTISRDGYSITFSNPRYENLTNQNNFKVNVNITNQSFKPSIKVIANCDLSENEKIVKEGVGVSVASGEAKELLPGNSSAWTALVILDNKNQKISSCLYSPEGIFDPNQTVRVVF